jgi:hypothetical protein
MPHMESPSIWICSKAGRDNDPGQVFRWERLEDYGLGMIPGIVDTDTAQIINNVKASSAGTKSTVSFGIVLSENGRLPCRFIKSTE